VILDVFERGLLDAPELLGAVLQHRDVYLVQIDLDAAGALVRASRRLHAQPLKIVEDADFAPQRAAILISRSLRFFDLLS
jgi:hypothetical protein